MFELLKGREISGLAEQQLACQVRRFVWDRMIGKFIPKLILAN
jgi:hypothetical protein